MTIQTGHTVFLVIPDIRSWCPVFMATDRTGSLVEIDIDLEARVLVSICGEMEQLIRSDSRAKLDQPGFVLIRGAVHIMARGTHQPLVLHMDAVKFVEPIGTRQNLVGVMACPTQTVVGMCRVRDLFGIHDIGPSEQGMVCRAMGDVAMAAAGRAQPLGMGCSGKSCLVIA